MCHPRATLGCEDGYSVTSVCCETGRCNGDMEKRRMEVWVWGLCRLGLERDVVIHCSG